MSKEYFERNRKKKKEEEAANVASSSANKMAQEIEKQRQNDTGFTRAQKYFENKTIVSPEVSNETINRFLNDTKSYFQRAQERYNNNTYSTSKKNADDFFAESDSMRSRADEIRVFLSFNKDKIDKDTYNQLKSALDAFDSGSSSYRAAFSKANNYYSNWKTEEAYNEAQRQAKLQNMSADELENKIKENKDAQKEAKKNRSTAFWTNMLDSLTFANSQNKGNAGERMKSGSNDYQHYADEVKQLKEEGAELRSYLNTAKDNDAREKIGKIGGDVKGMLDKIAETDRNIDYVTQAQANEERANNNSSSYSANEDYKNQLIKQRQELRDRLKGMASQYGFKDENELVNYYEKFYNERQTEATKNEIQDFAKEHPVLAEGLSLALNDIYADTGVALGSMLGTALDRDGTGLDQNSAWYARNNVRSAIEEQNAQSASDKIKIGDWDLGKDAYQMVHSALDSAVSMLQAAPFTMLVPEGVGSEAARKAIQTLGTTLISSRSAVQEIINQKENGASDLRAVSRGAAAWVIETLTETVGLDTLLGKTKLGEKLLSKGLVGIALNNMVGGVTEGSEELVGNWLTRALDVIDNMSTGEKAEWMKKYEQLVLDGVDKKEAQKQILSDMLSEDRESFIVGFGSGLGMAAVGSTGNALNALGNNMANTIQGAEIRAKGNPDALINYAQNIDADVKTKNRLEKLAQKAVRRETTAQKYKDRNNLRERIAATKANSAVGRLYSEILDEADRNDTKSAIRDRIAENGNVKEEDAKALADIVFKEATGEELTKTERKQFEASEEAQSALKELIGNAEWSRNYGTRTAVENAAYGVDKETALKVTPKENKDVPVKQIARVKAYTPTSTVYTDAEGNTVNGDDITLGKGGDRLLNLVNRKGDINYANIVLENYNGQSVVRYTNAASRFYEAGRNDESFDAVKKIDIYGNYIDENTARALYQAGKHAVVRDSKGRVIKTDKGLSVAKHYSDEEYNKKQKTGGVIRNYTRKLNMGQKSFVTFASKVGEKFGVVFVIDDTIDGGRTNGFYNYGNEIHIALDARGELYTAVAGHELYHYLKQNADRNSIVTFNKTVLDSLKKNGFNLEAEIKKEREGKYGDTMTDDEIIEEIIADNCYSVLTSETIEDIVKKDASLGEKIKDFISKFIEAVREAGGSLNKDMTKYLDIDALKSIEKQFATLLEQANNKSDYTILDDGDIEEIDELVNKAESAQNNYISADGTEYAGIPSASTYVLGDKDVSFSVNTYNEKLPKFIMTKSGKAYMIDSMNGREVLKSLITENNKSLYKRITSNLDMMSRFMKNAEIVYTKIGLEDVNNASISYDAETGRYIFSAMVKNGEYPVNFDFTTICKKRDAAGKFFERILTEKDENGNYISKEYPLNDHNMFLLNEALRESGYETACLGCFVESKRYNSLSWAATIVNEWNDAVESVNKNAEWISNKKDEIRFSDAEIKAFEDAMGEDTENARGQAWEEKLKAAEENVDEKLEAFTQAVANRKDAEKAVELLSKTKDDAKKQKAARELEKAKKAEEKAKSAHKKAVDSREKIKNSKSKKSSISTTQKMQILVKNNPSLQKKIKISDLLTADGIDLIAREYPELLSFVKSRYGTSTPKLVQGFTPYNNEIAFLSVNKAMNGSLETRNNTLRKYLKEIGGIRMQSFSDFRIENVFDYMQMFADAAMRGFPAHAYTKEISFAKIFGMMGAKTNLSVMYNIMPASYWEQYEDKFGDKAENLAKKYAGMYVDENGQIANLIADKEMAKMFKDKYGITMPVQSIDYNEAVKLQNTKGYDRNVGIIGVAFSDEQVRSLLRDSNVRYVIPYHRSSLPTDIAHMSNLSLARDFTKVQNTLKVTALVGENGRAYTLKEWLKQNGFKTVDSSNAIEAVNAVNNAIANGEIEISTKKAKAGHGDFNLYNDLEITNNPKKTVSNYVADCLANGNLPMFYEFADEDNYYKVHFDFSVYDKNGNYAPQNSVKWQLPDNVTGLIEGYMKEANDYATEQFTEEKMSSTEENWKRMVDSEKTESKVKASRNAEYLEAVENGDEEEAQRLVDEAAKDWGALTDNKGNVLKLYHGTSNGEFFEFDEAKQGENYHGWARLGKGFYFTKKESSAKIWAEKGKGVNEKVISVYIQMKNGLDVYEAVPEKLKKWLHDNIYAEDGFDESTEEYMNRKLYRFIDYLITMQRGDEIKSVLSNLGYDGIYSGDGEEYVVWNANQIKSADTVTYDNGRNVIPLSERFSEKKDIRWSLNDVRENLDTLEELVEDDEDAAKIVKLLKDDFKVTNRHNLSREDIDRKARQIVKNWDSNYDAKKLADNLEKIYDYVANGVEVETENGTETEAPSFETAFNAMRSLAREVMEDSYHEEVSERTDRIKELKKELRSTRIYVNDIIKGEIAYSYDSYEKFRRSHIGKLRLVNDKTAMGADEAYMMFREEYPEFFEGDAPLSSSDMLKDLIDIADSLEPTYQADYFIEPEQITNEIAEDIYEGFYDIKEHKTLVEQQKALRQKQKARYEEKLEEVKARYEGRIKSEKAAKWERVAKEREEVLKAVARKELRKEGTENRRAIRKKISAKVKKLNNLLVNPTDQKHIPEELKTAVTQFCDIMSSTGVFSKDRIAALQSYYAKLAEVASGEYISGYDEDIQAMLEELAESLGGRRLAKLNAADLNKVLSIANNLDFIVTTLNEMEINGKKEKVESAGNQAIAEADDKGTKKRIALLNTSFINKMKRSTFYGNLKPVMFFKDVVTGKIAKLYDDIAKGEDTWAVRMLEARDFFTETAKKYNFYKWADYSNKRHGKAKKTVNFTTAQGKKVELSTEEALSLYCTAKRNQGLQHILGGGFIPSEGNVRQIKEGKGKVSYEIIDKTPIVLNQDDLVKLASALTEEQKQFGDEMVKYLSTDVAKYGNDTSMKLFGYRKYLESYYFPISSSENYVYSRQTAVQDDTRLKHQSMTKATVPNANNPIVISPFIEVWGRHINDMASYSSFVVALENFNKVWNFRERNEDGTRGMSVKNAIENAYGNEATSYINQLMIDINGGVTMQNDTTASILMSKFKKGAVMASLSVSIQQPSAIARALALVDSRYFLKTTLKGRGEKTYEEMMKYAPVAIIKEMGFFDTGMGRRGADWVTAREYDKAVSKEVGISLANAKQKGVAMFKDANFRDEVMGWLPGMMDKITWCHIWNAVKAETAAKTNLKGEELLKKAGERFTQVIHETQVYDSVFSRSENMRSKNPLTQMATAFMAEPTTALNMFIDSVVNAKNGQIKNASRTIAALVSSYALNAFLVSFIRAARDDDDKNFEEKYLVNFVSEFLQNLNPANQIPYLRDIINLAKGYDVERSDMSVIADLMNLTIQVGKTITGTEEWTDENKKKLTDQIVTLFGVVSELSGVPVNNIIRDAKGLRNVLWHNTNDRLTWDSLWNSILKEYDKGLLAPFIKTKSNYDLYYDALIRGDGEAAERIRGGLDESKINDRMLKLLKKNEDIIKAANSDTISAARTLADELVKKGFDEETVWKAIKGAIAEDETEKKETEEKETDSSDEIKALLKKDKRIEQAAQLRAEGNKSGWERIRDELVNEGYDRNTVNSLIKDEVSNLSKQEETKEDTEETKDNSSEKSEYSAADINASLSNGRIADAQSYLDDVYEKNSKVYAGGASKAKSTIKSNITSYFKPQYINGDRATRALIRSRLMALKVDGEPLYTEKNFNDWLK